MGSKGKNPVGRPRKFQTIEAMQKAIDAYFDKCDKRTKEVVVHGKDGGVFAASDPEPYTVTGLALALGIDRHTLLDYETEGRTDPFGGKFHPTIKAAKERVHHCLERRLYDGVGYGPGHIFGLKNNYQWRDTHDHKHSGQVSLRFDKQDEAL